MRASAEPFSRAIPGDLPPRPRLAFLDGLRGLAALYVVNHHILHDVGWRRHGNDWPLPLAWLINLMNYGHFAVGLFIVLSGFCLMLPVLRTPGHDVPGGFAAFARRRARRILPPYYAAILFSLLLIWLVPATKYGGYANFDLGIIASHLLLLHNLRDEWVYGINGPMWSVATEWQIYFAFFALLLPVWRRWGSAVTVALSFLIGIGAFMLFPAELYRSCPWYLGLFALGMAAASLVTCTDPAVARCRASRWPAITAITVPALFVWAILTFFPQWTWYDRNDERVGEMVVVMDIAWGVAVAGFLVFLSTRAIGGGEYRPLLIRLLESRPAVALGACSYSLYLVHMPLVKLVWATLQRQGLSRTANYLWMLGIAIPLALAVAYVFYRLFEKPFLGAGAAAPVPEQRPSGARGLVLAG